MSRIVQIVALGMLIFGAGFVCRWLFAGPNMPSSAEQVIHEPEAIRHAEEEYATGVKYEHLGDLDHAIQQYESLKKAFPKHPTIDYSIGVCQQKQGKTAEAVEAFRRVAGAPDAPKEIIEDAKLRVQKLLSPGLTPSQQTHLDLADDYMRTGEDLKEGVKEQVPATPPSNSSNALPLEHAVWHLELLRQEKPDYIPLYFRIGIVNELLGRHLDAYYGYLLYLTGYERFKIPYANQQHEIRRRMLNCETILGLNENQVFVKSHASNQYLHHKTVENKEVAELSPVTSPDDRAAAKFTVSWGIAAHTGISL
jgi:tetratricopeptide (TPR) repeat protein